MRRAFRWLAPALALAAVPFAAPAAEPVEIRPGKDSAALAVGGKVVARYHTAPGIAKPHFWPVLAPNGAAVTRGWPMTPAPEGGSKDHVHQKSLWFCHGDVIPEGVALKHKIRGVEGVDFWSETKGHGRIVCVDPGSVDGGGKSATLTTRNEWQTADGEKILDEARAISLHDLGGQGWLLVLDIDLHAADGPVTFGDTKEGSMGVRVNDQIRGRGGNGTMTNAAGKKGEKEIWGHTSDWVDYSGTIDGKPAGIAVFDDPDNPVRACWHARDYGLLAANPFGRNRSGFPDRKGMTDLVKLGKGEHLRLRYGVYVHDGDAQSGKVAEAFEYFKKLGK